MPRLLFLLITFTSTAIAVAADTATIPEIEGPRAAYHQALAKIRAERDQKSAEATRTYAARLQDLQKKLSEEGEVQAAEAVKAEIDRVAKGVEPTNEERRKMTGLLLATRVLYEKNRGPAYMAAAMSEAQAHEAWATGLAQLEAHLIKLRQFAKVTVVKAEQARLEQAKSQTATAAAAIAATSSPTAMDPAELTAKLRGTRWHLPDVRSHPPAKQWIEFGEDGKTSAGWHGRRAAWRVLPDGRVEADWSYRRGNTEIVHLAPDLQSGTYGDKNYVMRRIAK